VNSLVRRRYVRTATAALQKYRRKCDRRSIDPNSFPRQNAHVIGS
jgi:hypothetical protein